MPNRPKSSILKITLTLALAAAAAYGVIHFFGAKASHWDGSAPEGSVAEIVRAELKRDYQNGILTLEIAFENTTGKPVSPLPPFARLLTADDQPVFPYSLDAASDPVPVISSGQRKSLVLRYWLEPKHFASPLHFFAGTDKIPVKSEAAFDIQSITNQGSVTLHSPDWIRP